MNADEKEKFMVKSIDNFCQLNRGGVKHGRYMITAGVRPILVSLWLF